MISQCSEMRLITYYPVNSLQCFCFKIDTIIMMLRTSPEFWSTAFVSNFFSQIFDGELRIGLSMTFILLLYSAMHSVIYWTRDKFHQQIMKILWSTRKKIYNVCSICNGFVSISNNYLLEILECRWRRRCNLVEPWSTIIVLSKQIIGDQNIR